MRGPVGDVEEKGLVLVPLDDGGLHVEAREHSLATEVGMAVVVGVENMVMVCHAADRQNDRRRPAAS